MAQGVSFNPNTCAAGVGRVRRRAARAGASRPAGLRHRGARWGRVRWSAAHPAGCPRRRAEDSAGSYAAGEQLAWYSSRRSPGRPPTPAAAAPERGDPVAGLVRLLSEAARALSPKELIARGPDGLQVPGLYSWWVDGKGAADLSRGLGLPVAAGLIYAGQAGATRWPSGKQSASTLWTRITGMHLGGAAEFSTFRRTLAAILRPVLGMTGEDDPQLSAWMKAHLRIIAVPAPDASRLGQAEAVVLDALDPPLNLQGRSSSPVRSRLVQEAGADGFLQLVRAVTGEEHHGGQRLRHARIRFPGGLRIGQAVTFSHHRSMATTLLDGPDPRQGRPSRPGRGFLPFLRGRGPRGAPGAIGVVSPVEVLVADEVQRRRTLDSGG